MVSQSSGTRKSRGWGSFTSFVLAAIGSSIGLGNLWKFPYELGQHGGTFLFVYLVCVLLVGFPLMVSELIIGRVGKGGPVFSVRKLARELRLSSLWSLIGWLGILTSFLIFSFYCVVGSWILFYLMQFINNSYSAVPAEIVQHSFSSLLRNTDQMLIWHSVFVLMVVSVLSQPVRIGLERALRFLMPLLAVLVIWLYLNLGLVGDVDAAKTFMFTFEWRAISAELIVAALTQALFSLSIGVGILILYGSYLSSKRPIYLGAGLIVISDTLFALAMALLIFSIVFKFGLEADSGVGLLFETLPVAFSQLDGESNLLGSVFFMLFLIAALTSGFALLEPAIVLIRDKFRLQRRTSAWLVGFVAWLLGLLSIFSLQGDSFGFYYFSQEYKRGYFDLFNIVSTQFLLPLAALLITIFAGWMLPSEMAKKALGMRLPFFFRLWQFCSRSITPLIIALALILVMAVTE